MEILSLTLSAMGMALATSCFFVLTQGVNLADPYTMLVSLIPAGLLTLPTMLCFSEMASRYPKNTAGPAMFFIKALGKENAVWPMMFYLSIIGVVASVEIQLLSMLTNKVFPAIDKLTLTFLVTSLAYLANRKGWQISQSIQIICSLALFSIVIFLGLSGESEMQKTPIDELDLAALVAMSSFLFFGIEWICPFGKNKESYKLNMPLAMSLAVLFLGLMYGLIIYAGGHLAAELPLHYSLSFELFDKWGALLAMIISGLALFSSFHMGIMGGTKMVYAMGRIKVLPHFVSSIFSDSGRPKGALILLLGFVGFSNLIIFSYNLFEEVIVAGAVIQCLFYSMALEVLLRLRKNGGVALFMAPMNIFFVRLWQLVFTGVALAVFFQCQRPFLVLGIFIFIAIFITCLRLPFLMRRLNNVPVS